MEKHFVTYEQALALKELGFDEPCWSYFITPFDDGEGIFNPSMFLKDYAYLDTMPKHSTYILAPLKSQVFEWARKEHHLFGRVYPITVGGFANGEVPKDWQPEFLWEIYKPVGVRYYPKDNIVVKIGDNLFKSWYTYEEAESACIDKLIEIVKSKKQ